MALSLVSCTKLSDFGEYDRVLNISHSHLHTKAKINSNGEDIIINSSYIPTKYFDIIKQNLETVKLTEREFMDYKYQPKRYCVDKFGSIELWGLLLRINNMTSALDFNTDTFKVPKSNIFELLNEMLIQEAENIEKNNESIGI